MDHIDLLLECGFNKPLFKVQLEDKTNVIQTITLHKVILASLAELSQFREGLSAWAYLGPSRKTLTCYATTIVAVLIVKKMC